MWMILSKSSLRKHVFSNIWKISPPKSENFLIKNLIFFLYFCSKYRLWYSLEPPRRGGSNEYPQSMCSSQKKKKKRKLMYIPVNLQFCYIKVALRDNSFTHSLFIVETRWWKCRSQWAIKIWLRPRRKVSSSVRKMCGFTSSCTCTVWSGPSLSAYGQRLFFNYFFFLEVSEGCI